jgi:hypothetical protein
MKKMQINIKMIHKTNNKIIDLITNQTKRKYTFSSKLLYLGKNKKVTYIRNIVIKNKKQKKRIFKEKVKS